MADWSGLFRDILDPSERLSKIIQEFWRRIRPQNSRTPTELLRNMVNNIHVNSFDEAEQCLAELQHPSFGGYDVVLSDCEMYNANRKNSQNPNEAVCEYRIYTTKEKRVIRIMVDPFSWGKQGGLHIVRSIQFFDHECSTAYFLDIFAILMEGRGLPTQLRKMLANPKCIWLFHAPGGDISAMKATFSPFMIGETIHLDIGTNVFNSVDIISSWFYSCSNILKLFKMGGMYDADEDDDDRDYSDLFLSMKKTTAILHNIKAETMMWKTMWNDPKVRESIREYVQSTIFQDHEIALGLAGVLLQNEWIVNHFSPATIPFEFICYSNWDVIFLFWNVLGLYMAKFNPTNWDPVAFAKAVLDHYKVPKKPAGKPGHGGDEGKPKPTKRRQGGDTSLGGKQKKKTKPEPEVPLVVTTLSHEEKKERFLNKLTPLYRATAARWPDIDNIPTREYEAYMGLRRVEVASHGGQCFFAAAAQILWPNHRYEELIRPVHAFVRDAIINTPALLDRAFMIAGLGVGATHHQDRIPVIVLRSMPRDPPPPVVSSLRLGSDARQWEDRLRNEWIAHIEYMLDLYFNQHMYDLPINDLIPIVFATIFGVNIPVVRLSYEEDRRDANGSRITRVDLQRYERIMDDATHQPLGPFQRPRSLPRPTPNPHLLLRFDQTYPAKAHYDLYAMDYGGDAQELVANRPEPSGVNVPAQPVPAQPVPDQPVPVGTAASPHAEPQEDVAPQPIPKDLRRGRAKSMPRESDSAQSLKGDAEDPFAMWRHKKRATSPGLPETDYHPKKYRPMTPPATPYPSRAQSPELPSWGRGRGSFGRSSRLVSPERPGVDRGRSSRQEGVYAGRGAAPGRRPRQVSPDLPGRATSSGVRSEEQGRETSSGETDTKRSRFDYGPREFVNSTRSASAAFATNRPKQKEMNPKKPKRTHGERDMQLLEYRNTLGVGPCDNHTRTFAYLREMKEFATATKPEDQWMDPEKPEFQNDPIHMRYLRRAQKLNVKSMLECDPCFRFELFENLERQLSPLGLQQFKSRVIDPMFLPTEPQYTPEEIRLFYNDLSTASQLFDTARRRIGLGEATDVRWTIDRWHGYARFQFANLFAVELRDIPRSWFDDRDNDRTIRQVLVFNYLAKYFQQKCYGAPELELNHDTHDDLDLMLQSPCGYTQMYANALIESSYARAWRNFDRIEQAARAADSRDYENRLMQQRRLTLLRWEREASQGHQQALQNQQQAHDEQARRVRQQKEREQMEREQRDRDAADRDRRREREFRDREAADRDRRDHR